MSKFKVGDKVMLINVDRYTYYVDNIPNKLLGKPLVINSISTDKNGNEIVYAGVPEGVCCWQWYSDDLQLVSEAQAESAEQAPAEVPEPKHSKQFKVGDYVVVIAGPQKSKRVRTLKERSSAGWCYPLCIGSQCYNSEGKRSWTEPVCLRHATEEEIAAMQKPKLLDRGDLVEYLGEVWIVTIGTAPTDIFAKISTMTGKERTRLVTAYDVTRVGNIRKKIKRLKAQMGDEK